MQVLVSTSPGTSSWLVKVVPPSSTQPAPQAGAPSLSWPDGMGVLAVTAWVSFQ